MIEILSDELEQVRVQLAGCLTAAEGAIKDPAKRGDYGWSLAYQAVLDLRARNTELERLIELQHKRVREVEKLWQAATGKTDTHPDLGELVWWLRGRMAALQRHSLQLRGALISIAQHSCPEPDNPDPFGRIKLMGDIANGALASPLPTAAPAQDEHDRQVAERCAKIADAKGDDCADEDNIQGRIAADEIADAIRAEFGGKK